VLDAHLDELEGGGLGDPTLADLVSESSACGWRVSILTGTPCSAICATRGFSALLNDIDRAAAKSGAPFIQSDVTLAAARSQWSHAFSAMGRLAALEDAMDQAKQAMASGAGASDRVIALKTERDALRRALKTGTIWDEDGSF